MVDPGSPPVALYDPLPLNQAPPSESLELALRAADGRLAFYIGAGLSMSPPTALPSGSEVQARIADRARRLLGVEVTNPAGEQPTLEELGNTALTLGSTVLDRLRDLAADAVDFVNPPPNFAHEAVALLLRDGMVQVLTVNWDCGVEHAARDLGYAVRRVVRQAERTYGPTGPVIDKLNGCASEPATLRITQSEVDIPQQWAAHRVGAVLTDSTVIFIGLGTVGTYVSDGVERMLAEAHGRPVTVVVVSPTLSDGWKKALGTNAGAAHQAVGAEQFLDDLLRAVVRFALTRALERAGVWAANGHSCSAELTAGRDRLFSAFEEHSALPVWRWWRDGACGQASGKPFILDRVGEVALATVCALVADHELVVSGDGDSLIVELPDRYLEVCSWPGEPAAVVATRQADRIRKRRRRGTYGDLSKQIVSVSVGHDGPLPGISATTDVAGADAPMTDIFDGSERMMLGWVGAGRYLCPGRRGGRFLMLPVDHPLVEAARSVLSESGYETSPQLLEGLEAPVLVIESPFVIGAIVAGDYWKSVERFVDETQVALSNWASQLDRSSRRWDLYVVVLLEHRPETPDEGAAIERAEADTNLARKIVRSAVTSPEDARPALRSLLPLVAIGRTAVPDLAQALEDRLGVHGIDPVLARRAVAGFIQTGTVRI